MAGLKIFCFIVFAYGVSNMVVYARGPFAIFEKCREVAARINRGLGEMFSCMICFPTWVGIVSSAMDILYTGFAFTPFNLLLGDAAPWWLVVGMDACFTSGIVWLTDQVESAVERHGQQYGENEE